jgi:hypothetical protein
MIVRMEPLPSRETNFFGLTECDFPKWLGDPVNAIAFGVVIAATLLDPVTIPRADFPHLCGRRRINWIDSRK